MVAEIMTVAGWDEVEAKWVVGGGGAAVRCPFEG